jgi:hypothetical protein
MKVVSIEPVSHLVHLGGDAVAVRANFNNVHGGTPLERGDLECEIATGM